MPQLKPRISGFLFPLPHDQAERLFSDKKTVFVKFGRYNFLVRNLILKFYDSGIHAIVGQARIKEIVVDCPKNIWEKYANSLVLNEIEFEQYMSHSPLGPRKIKILTAFLLEEVTKYPKPLKPPKRVTPAGYYLPPFSYFTASTEKLLSEDNR